MSRQAELVKGQVKDQSEKQNEAVKTAGDRPRTFNDKRQQQPHQKQQFKRGNPNPSKQQPQCSRSNRRHKMDHFQVCCRSKSAAVRKVLCDENDDSEDVGSGDYGTVDCTGYEEPWLISLNICSTDVAFKIDAGADPTIISEKTYTSLKRRPSLKRVTLVLTSPVES